MKVLLCGDAVQATGFAACMHAACKELVAAGHEVHVVGLNYFGGRHEEPYSIYPAFDPTDGGRDVSGAGRTARLASRLRPDAIVYLNDPWNIRGYLEYLRDAWPESNGQLPPVFAWLACDGENQACAPELNVLAGVAVWTKFAQRVLSDSGCASPIEVVPLGVDLELFHPYEQRAAREALFSADAIADCEGKFVVGVVGRNQPRKRLDLTVRYFAMFCERYGVDDARLFLHVAPTGETGVDLHSLIRYYKLQDKVLLYEPPAGPGVRADLMPLVYSACDLYWNTSQGEGWGLPALEAMACGVPCLLPDFAAYSEAEGWTGGAARLVSCEDRAISGPWNARAYVLGGVTDAMQTCKELARLRGSKALRDELAMRGLEVASRYPWSASGRAFREWLERAVAVHSAQSAAAAETTVGHEISFQDVTGVAV